MDTRTDDLQIGTALGVPLADEAASAIKNTATSIRNRAKAKKAQKISDAGGYGTLTPFQRSLIPVPAYWGTDTSAKENLMIDEETTSSVKKYVPYIIGALFIGILIFFIVKRK